MKLKLVILIMTSLAICPGARGTGTAASLGDYGSIDILLRDQFGERRRLDFPNAKPLILVIADRQGAEQIQAWVEPVKRRFGDRVDIRGIADVSTVPRLLRGFVRGKFEDVHTYPVMLDWTGEVARAFDYTPGAVQVLLLDSRGIARHKARGKADLEAARKLCELVSATLEPQASTL